MPTVAINFVLIVVARITDVSIDTIRTASIIQGRRAFAAVLGFFEAVIYICVVAKVLLNMKQPVYALAYGVGFASGFGAGGGAGGGGGAARGASATRGGGPRGICRPTLAIQSPKLPLLP